jgi:hypothetical protein
LAVLAGVRTPTPSRSAGWFGARPKTPPLAGVSVTLKAKGILNPSPFPVLTGPDGRFVATFRVVDIEFMHEELPKWSLVLSKEGYQEQTLDVSLKQKPESTKKTTAIDAEGSLQAK